MLHQIMGFERALPWLIGAFAMGYLIGSLPFGIMVTRLFGLGDLRKIGSGNIGATNVLRTGNKPAAAATLLLDALKGAVPVALALAYAGDLAAQAAGLGALIGHCFPVWLRFRGGKGVATMLGVLFGLSWPVGLAACATWMAAAGLSRISSVGGLAAVASGPLWLWLMDGPRAVILGALMALLVTWRHRENIARLIAGTEPRIGQSKTH